MRSILMGLVMAGGLVLSPGIGRAVVDPQCVLQARDDFLTCKGECRTTFRDDKFRCRNVDPTCVPYYLLVVGCPARIPFGFCRELSVEYAVGLLSFDTAAGYAASRAIR